MISPGGAGAPLRLASGNAASGRTFGGPFDLAPWARGAGRLGVDVLAVQEVDHLLPRSARADQTGQVAAALQEGGTAGSPAPRGPWWARFAPAVLGTPGRGTMRPAPGPVPDRGDLAASGAYGVALLSRHPVEEWHELRMAPSAARMPVPDEQRVALAAVVHAPAARVTVVTTHLSFVPRRARAQLAELLDWAHPLPRPLVLLGDLNLPHPVPARATGWEVGVRAATFPAQVPLLQLDHVLLDAGDHPVRLVRGHALRLPGSDHLAVRADLAPGGHPDGQ